MKQSIRLSAMFLSLSGVLLLSACSGTGGYSTVHYGVYSGYGYPSYGGGNNYYYYNNRPNNPNRPDRPVRPERPSTQPVQRPGGGMGRPVRAPPGGGGFGGGGRGRR